MFPRSAKRIPFLVLACCLYGVAIAQTDTLPAHEDSVRIPTGETAEIAFPAGRLLHDDPAFNKRSPLWIPAVRVVNVNLFNWTLARYVFNYDWARVSPESWKNNLKTGFQWDDDRFGMNFIGHPHTGSYYFNVARSNGYTYLQSLPFAVAGSIIWEYFGENTPPSRNDLINTPLSGSMLGEILYRISSNILDDRTGGKERFLREAVAALINPTRALNRFTQGRFCRRTDREIYQKEPLEVTFNFGLHKVNESNKFATGLTNAIINLQLDYGDPFEVRPRKPMDHFRLRLESRYGDDQKLIDNVIGYGFLFGKNISSDNYGMLIGGFQHFDYWNNRTFELGALGFGPGAIFRFRPGEKFTLYSSLHVAGVPLAANTTRFGPDTSEFRDYPFGGGFQARIEEAFNFGNFASLGFTGYHYRIWHYEGIKGRTHISILKPRVTVNILRNWSLGIEHQVYFDNRMIEGLPPLRLRQTEQKFFLQYRFGLPR
ncbi:MAG TPA: DUF3943 domain-containing protein [Chitinophagaceae bacterium]|nr:DUF3943 domain-containing protein [Chitinophagaceae bacterium]